MMGASEKNGGADEPTSYSMGTRGGYYAFLLFEGVLRLLPLSFWCRFGRFMGGLGYYFLPSIRKRILHNMRIIGRNSVSEQGQRQWAYENFKTVVCNFLAAAKAGVMSDKSLSSHFTVVGKEHVMQGLALGHGVICVISHMGNWELLARVRVRFLEVSRFGSMYRELDNPLIEKLWRDRRQRSGCEMFGKKTSSFADVTSIVRDNGMLGILCDQNAGGSGKLIPYFGKLASTTILPALLQRRSKAPLIPVTVRTTSLAHWEVCFGSPIDISQTKNYNQVTALINAELERKGRESIIDGFWLHNRWKQDAVFPPKHEPLEWKIDLGGEENCYDTVVLPCRMLLVAPKMLSESILMLRVMRAISRARTDVQWTILCEASQFDFWSNWKDEILGEFEVYTYNHTNVRLLVSQIDALPGGGIDDAFILNPDKAVYAAVKAKTNAHLWALNGENPYLKRWKNVCSYTKSLSVVHRLEVLNAICCRLGVTMEIEDLSLGKQDVSVRDKYVFISPFAPLGDEKYEWVESGWTHIVHYLKEKGFTCVLLASTQVAEDKVRDLSNTWGIDSFRAETTELRSKLKKGQLLVSIDGDMPHIASLEGTPSVVLYGPRMPKQWHPVGVVSKSVAIHKDCCPCRGAVCSRQKSCLKELSEEKVLKLLEEMIGENLA